MGITLRMPRASMALVLCFWAGSVGALDLQLNAPGFPEEGMDTLRGASLVLQSTSTPDITAQDIVAAARADYGRLTAALYEMGYYGPVINITVNGQEAANISPLQSPSAVNQVILQIDAGPTFTFADMSVTPIAPGTELPEGFRTGARAHSSVIVGSAAASVDGWRDIGHAKANVSQQTITADHRNQTVSTDIRIAPGPQLTFGTLKTKVPSRVRAARIQEIAGLPTGEVFSPEEVRKASQRLRRTGAFRSITLTEADQISAGNTLDINAALEDAKPRRIGFGAELSSLEGLTLGGFWMHRNLLGGAERLRIEGEISGIGGDSGGIDYHLSARFDRPATFTPDTGLFIEAITEELNEPNYRERNASIGAGFSHIFSEKLTGEAGFAYQYTEIDDDFGSRTLEHILLPVKLTFDDRDDQLNATKGVYVDLEATPFVGIGDDVAGARLYLDARAYRSFGQEGDTVVALRAQMGSVFGASFQDVPSNMLFYSGGAGTVRGQSYQSLGVDLPGGGLIGGRSFAAFSTELRQSLWGPWSVVGFADAGFVGSDSLGERNGDWHAGAGFGARYDTGFGPIRVDVATPLDSGAGQDFELYIGIGQAF